MNCFIILLLLFCCGNNGVGGDCNRCEDKRGCEGQREGCDRVCRERCDDACGCMSRCDEGCECRERAERECAGNCRDQRCARDDRRDDRRSEDCRRSDSDCCDNRGMRMSPWQDFSGCGRSETCGCEEKQ